MKLSEAMMLGDSMRKRNPQRYLEKDCGCALGGAVLAAGGTYEERKKSGHFTSCYLLKFWPWVTHEHERQISAGFFRVCDGSETLEQLVDYVRSIEPACGICNRFECTCAKQVEPQGAEDWVPFHG